MCQLCPCPASPSTYNSQGEELDEEELERTYTETEVDEEYEQQVDRWRPSGYTKTLVQPAPSHDGAPIFAAYEVPASFLETEAELRTRRPPFGVVVYDTTHTARPQRSARLARALFDGTFDYRRRPCHKPDRLEVVTLPLPPASSDDERVEACIRHYEEEVRTRMLIPDLTEAASWFLPERIMDRYYTRLILVITCFKDDGSDDAVMASLEEAMRNEDPDHPARDDPDASCSGTYLHVNWHPRERKRSALPHDPPQVKFHRRGFEEAEGSLSEMVDAVDPFYNHFVPDRVLNLQLLEARKG